MTGEIKLSPKSYYCKNCAGSFIVPNHCGRPMNLENDGSKKFWLCWKGEHEPCCSSESLIKYDQCCESPNLVAAVEVQTDKVLL